MGELNFQWQCFTSKLKTVNNLLTVNLCNIAVTRNYKLFLLQTPGNLVKTTTSRAEIALIVFMKPFYNSVPKVSYAGWSPMELSRRPFILLTVHERSHGVKNSIVSMHKPFLWSDYHQTQRMVWFKHSPAKLLPTK